MNALLAELLSISQAALLTGYVVFLRVGAAMAFLPAFGERIIPIRVRLGLALAFTLIVAPAVAPLIVPDSAPGLARLLLTETLAGLSIGAAVRFFVLILQIAGSIAAQTTSLSQLFGGATADPAPVMGNIFLYGGLALAVTAGLHVRLAELLIGSYQVFPLGRLPDAELLAQWGVARAAHAFALAFALAAPFAIASLIYNVALGVINRAMPQLMVAFVGAPAITAGGLILLALATPFLLSVWLAAFNDFLAAPFGGY